MHSFTRHILCWQQDFLMWVTHVVLFLKTKRGCGASRGIEGSQCMLPRVGPGGNPTKGIPIIEHWIVCTVGTGFYLVQIIIVPCSFTLEVEEVLFFCGKAGTQVERFSTLRENLKFTKNVNGKCICLRKTLKVLRFIRLWDI